MSMIYAAWRPQFDKVITSPASRRRLIDLHKHRKARVRKKYQHAVVVMTRHPPTVDNVWAMLDNIRNYGGMTDRALRQFCRVLRHYGIDARMEKRR